MRRAGGRLSWANIPWDCLQKPPFDKLVERARWRLAGLMPGSCSAAEAEGKVAKSGEIGGSANAATYRRALLSAMDVYRATEYRLQIISAAMTTRGSTWAGAAARGPLPLVWGGGGPGSACNFD